MAEHVVAQVSAVPEQEGLLVTAGEKELALFQLDGAWFAIDNACPHRGGPLAEGHAEDGCVTCPWHGWEFDLAGGAAKHRPEIVAATYPVRIDGDDVKIDLPDERARAE